MCSNLTATPWQKLSAIGPIVGLLLCFCLVGVCTAQESRDDNQAEKGQDVVITIVYDNYPMDERLETKWGFACVVQGLDETILFDTGGDGELLLSNMAKVGIKPEQIDSVVLSHNHRDHTGGLDAFRKVNNEVKVYVPRLFPLDFRQHVTELNAELVETEVPLEICDGAWTTGVLEEPLVEQGICVESSEGLFVVTGCAHPGIARMAMAAKIRSKTPVHTVLGGFHMARAPDDRIKMATRRLKEIGVQCAAPSHCSGNTARATLLGQQGSTIDERGFRRPIPAIGTWNSVCLSEEVVRQRTMRGCVVPSHHFFRFFPCTVLRGRHS